jgi:hypothetical protein
MHRVEHLLTLLEREMDCDVLVLLLADVRGASQSLTALEWECSKA